MGRAGRGAARPGRSGAAEEAARPAARRRRAAGRGGHRRRRRVRDRPAARPRAAQP
ncbi:hypothetical protein ACFSTC_61825 [Nonomuraea ferruginea]